MDRTIDLLRDRFYWSYMLEDTKEHVGSCKRCQMAKGRQQLAPLQPYHASTLMELVYMDYMTIEDGKTGTDVNILIITDHYYRFAQAIKTPRVTPRVDLQYHIGVPNPHDLDQPLYTLSGLHTTPGDKFYNVNPIVQ